MDSDLGYFWVVVDVFVMFEFFVTDFVLKCAALAEETDLVGV